MNKKEIKLFKLLDTLNEEQFNELLNKIENKVYKKVLLHYWTIKKGKVKNE